jgi:hypothetical protein
LAAQNSFGICLERAIGVHNNRLLAAQYYHHAAVMAQMILDSPLSMDVVFNKISKWPLNIANPRPITAIPKQSSITIAVFACSTNGKLPIVRPKSFPIHHPSNIYLSDIFHRFLKDPEPLDESILVISVL